MFSEKIQYNAPVPGEEFKNRDLSAPAEAAKILFEKESQHGDDKELCLTIFSRTFGGVEAQRFQGQSTDMSAWRCQATINRNIRLSTAEARI